MKNTRQMIGARGALVCLFVWAICLAAAAAPAQRPGGRAGGTRNNPSFPPEETSRRPTAAERDMRGEESTGRSPAEIARERERRARDNSRRAAEDLRRYPGLAANLNATPDDLFAQYNSLLAANPDVRFEHFLVAHRLARNLGATRPDITAEAILVKLAQGHSLGRALQDLGFSSAAAREAQRNAEREVRESKRSPAQ